jgi:hypothetical protein
VPAFIGVAAHDQAVAFESFERVVDLADVQRPDRPRAPFELVSELIPVAGALSEDGEQALAY